MNKSVLIIGGSGFLGSALQKEFAKNSEYTVSSPLRCDLNLLEPDTLRKVGAYDVVVNLTGQISEDCVELNTTGVHNLIQAVQDSKAVIIQISTVLVYGTSNSVTEDSPSHPESEYAKSKVAAENLIREFLSEDRSLIVRLSNMYGSGQKKGLLCYLLGNISEGKDIAITDNNGDLNRHFLHVEDVAKIVYDLISHNIRRVINVAGSDKYSIRELVALCEKILGWSLVASYVDIPPIGNIGSISTERLEKLISVQFQHSVQEYLRENLMG